MRRDAPVLSVLFLVSTGLFAGCGEPATIAAPTSGEHAATTRVELGEMEVGDATGSFKLHADGAIDAPTGARIGTLRTNGELVSAQGKSVATLGADGKVDLGPEAQGISATIAEDGTLTVTSASGEALVVRISPDGTLTGPSSASGKRFTKGADTAAKRRAIMLVLLAVTLRRQPTTPPAAASASTTP